MGIVSVSRRALFLPLLMAYLTLVIYDNRTLVHCATWFDAARHERVMWRTTVSGNPGVPYAGERKSWIA